MSNSPLVTAARNLCSSLDPDQFLSEKVAYVYNPLDYASGPHETYLRLFGRGTRRCLFLGMNPGPWGMAQTGVPFGEIDHVRRWTGIYGEDTPEKTGNGVLLHPERGQRSPSLGSHEETFSVGTRFLQRPFRGELLPASVS